MDVMQAVQERHSVRAYTEQPPIRSETRDTLDGSIQSCNREGGLHITRSFRTASPCDTLNIRKK